MKLEYILLLCITIQIGINIINEVEITPGNKFSTGPVNNAYDVFLFPTIGDTYTFASTTIQQTVISLLSLLNNNPFTSTPFTVSGTLFGFTVNETITLPSALSNIINLGNNLINFILTLIVFPLLLLYTVSVGAPAFYSALAYSIVPNNTLALLIGGGLGIIQFFLLLLYII